MNNIRPRHLSTDESARSALWVGYSGMGCRGSEEKEDDEEKESLYRYHAKACDFQSSVCVCVSFLHPAVEWVTAHISDSLR